MADKAKRDGVAERVAEAAGHKTSAVDRARLPSADARLNALELSRLNTAQHHAAHPRSLRPTVPAMGTRLRRVLRSARPRIDRVPSVHAFASYARLVHGSKAAGGTRGGTAGQPIGPAPRQGAWSEAAPRCLRNHPPGQQLVARWEKTPGQGNARSLRAQTRGRAVDCLRKRQVACKRARCLPPSGRRAGQPGASRDAAGMRRERVGATPSPAASGNATARLGPGALSPRHGWDPRAASCKAGARRRRWPGLPRPRARHARASPLGSARLLRRTGGGHDILSRAQRIPARRRGPRPGRDEGTASRGGCRHAAWPPHTAITSGPQTD